MTARSPEDERQRWFACPAIRAIRDLRVPIWIGELLFALLATRLVMELI